MQYIGARYVPKFMGTFDPTQAYENMCVVDNGLGTSYISKIPTPVGTSLTDTTYWAIYGASSGAIINLQNQIDNINNTELPAIKDDIETLFTTTGASRKVICIGDSYLGGVGPSYSEVDSWGAKLRALLNNGSNTKIYGYGGSGFIGQVADHKFEDLLVIAAGDYSAAEKLEVTDIIVQGGLNDFTGFINNTYTTTDLTNAINSFTNYAHSTFPNAMIRIGFIGWGTDGVTTKQHMHKVLNCYKHCFNSQAPNKVQYMSGVEYIMPTMPDSEYYDYIHPDAGASQKIAEGILNCMMGGYGAMGIDCSVGISITYESGITQLALGGTLTIYGEHAKVDLYTLWIEFTNAINYTFDTDITIGRISGGIPLRATQTIKIPCTCFVDDANGVGTPYQGWLDITAGVVKIHLNTPFSGTTVKKIIAHCDTYEGNVLTVC